MFGESCAYVSKEIQLQVGIAIGRFPIPNLGISLVQIPGFWD